MLRMHQHGCTPYQDSKISQKFSRTVHIIDNLNWTYTCVQYTTTVLFSRSKTLKSYIILARMSWQL